MNGYRPAAAKSRFGPLFLAVVLAVLAMLPALTASPGAAARLPLEPANFTSVSVADRCTESVQATHETAATGKVTTVTLSGLGAACDGRELELTLYGAHGEALTSGRAPVATGNGESMGVTVPAYTPAEVAGIAVTVGSWGVPATWSYTFPAEKPLAECTVLNDPTGAKTCEVKDIRVDAWGYPDIDSYNLYATVESPSGDQDVEWELEINLADPEFKVLANLAVSNNDVTLSPGWTCSSMPMLKLRGRDEVNSRYIGGGKTVTVWVQGKSVSDQAGGGNLFNCS